MPSPGCVYHIGPRHVPYRGEIQRMLARDLISVDFHVRHRYVSPHTGQFMGTPQTFTYSSTLPTQVFLRDWPRLAPIQLLPILSHHYLFSLIPHIMSCATSMLRNRPVGPRQPRLFPLLVDILVLHARHREEHPDITDLAIQQSMQEVRMIPASDDAVASLERVKVVNDGSAEARECSICMEPFEDDEDASAMPCHHVYHNQCIVRWLKTSHMCPLCRYQIPVQ